MTKPSSSPLPRGEGQGEGAVSRRSWAPRAAMVVGALWLLLATAAGAQLPTPTPPATQPPAVPTIYTGDKPPIGLSGGADSIDALIAQFLAAVKAGDSAALHRLRVTENEYDNPILKWETEAWGEVPADYGRK